MLTLRELGLLGRDTLALWARFFPVIAGWFALGYGIRLMSMQLAVIVGTERVILGNLIFVLGLVAWILALVLMIASLGPGLRFDRATRLDGALGKLYSVRNRNEVLLHGAAPFVALYAVGGFAAEQVDQLQGAALSILHMDYHQYQLVRFDQWHVFAIMAALAWLVQQGAALLHGKRPNLATGVVQVAAKATVVLATFIVLTELGGRFLGWLTERAFVGWLAQGWEAVLAALPEWELAAVVLPEAVRAAGEYLIGVILPGAVTAVVIPLTWLALTASVFGWRTLERNVIGLSAEERALLTRAERLRGTRLGLRVQDAMADGPVKAAIAFLRHLGGDYLPVVQGVRLIARAGARFVAAYLVAYAVLALADRAAKLAVWEADTRLPGDQHVFDTVGLFLASMVITTLTVALYAQGFDRALLAAARGPGQEPASANALAGKPGTTTTT